MSDSSNSLAQQKQWTGKSGSPWSDQPVNLGHFEAINR
jgi:hypothetical protein